MVPETSNSCKTRRRRRCLACICSPRNWPEFMILSVCRQGPSPLYCTCPFGQVRLLMRREKTMKICANFYVAPGTDLKENAGSDRSWVWQCTDFSEEKTELSTLAIRFANSESMSCLDSNLAAFDVYRGDKLQPQSFLHLSHLEIRARRCSKVQRTLFGRHGDQQRPECGHCGYSGRFS